MFAISCNSKDTSELSKRIFAVVGDWINFAFNFDSPSIHISFVTPDRKVVELYNVRNESMFGPEYKTNTIH